MSRPPAMRGGIDAGAPEHGVVSAQRRRAAMKRVGLAIGLLLLIAAMVFVVRRHDAMAAAIGSIRQQPVGTLGFLLAIVFGSIFLNIALSGLLFSILIAPHGRVGRMEMQSLIAATALMNYLPVPAFVGRMAYHKTVNGIALRDSGKTVIQAMALSAAVAMWFAACIAFAGRGQIPMWLPVAAPVPVIAAGAVFSRHRLIAAALLVRYFDALVTASRYMAAFALIGPPISAEGALAFSAINMIATMVPFLGNGLGLREWAVGLATPLMLAGQMEQGIAADLLNRAAEMVVFAAAGSIAIAWLARRRTPPSDQVVQ